MQNFSYLALKLREEFEVTDRRTTLTHPSTIFKISNFSISFCRGQNGGWRGYS